MLTSHGGTRADARSSHPEYPLERVCSYASEPFQLTFARNARQHFLTREDVQVVASHGGLTIRAETEAAIDAALALLKDLYGPRLRIGPPTVLYHQGLTLEQPWMGLRVRCPAEHFDAVNADLLDRDATILTCRIDGSLAHVEARSPLASLLGYGASLDASTAGSSQHSLWLSHYAPLVPSPPDGRAA
jgi:translation elongation factor EF-G